MTNLARQQLLDQALQISQRMAAAGADDAWAQVIELEPKRRRLLEQAFATREPIDERLASRVREILDLDKILLERSIRVRDAIAAELGSTAKARKVASAYNGAGMETRR